MAMSKRSLLNRIIRIASALALLVAMTSSPLRPFHSGSSSLCAECARPHWAGSSGRSSIPTRILPNSISMRPVSVKAIPCENEEEDLDGACRPALYFFVSSLPVSAISIENLATHDIVHSLHPLRC